MKINPVKYLPLVLLALTLAGAALPSRGKGKKTARELPAAETEQQRKADYIFMEAMRRNAVGEDDSYFELLNGAYSLDSTDTSVGQTLGYYYLALGQTDSVMAM